MIVNLTNNISLEIPLQKIGVLVSGGADSALLLYFLLKYSKTQINIFSLACNNKFSANIKNSINVIHKCAELTNNYNFIHHIKYDIEQNVENLFYLPNLYIEKKEIDCYFTGVTKNPPFYVTNNFKNTNLENHERNPDIIRETKKGNVYIPWTNLDKKDLAMLYKKYNLLENLFPLLVVVSQCTKNIQTVIVKTVGGVRNVHGDLED